MTFAVKKIPPVRQILIVLVLFVSLPPLVFLAWFKGNTDGRNVKAASGMVMELARGVGVAVEARSGTILVLLDRLADMEAVRDLDRSKASEIFRQQLAASNACKDIFLSDRAGRVLASGRADAPADVRDMLGPDTGEEKRILPSYWGGPYENGVVPHVRSLGTDADGRPAHYFVALLDTAHVGEVVAKASRGDGWSLAIVDENAVLGVEYFPELGESASRPGRRVSEAIWSRIRNKGGDIGWFEEESGEEGKRLWGFAKLRLSPESPVYAVVLASCKESVLLGNMETFPPFIPVMMGGIVTLAVLAFFIGMFILIFPLERFIAAVQNFASGDLHVRTGIDYGSGEIGVLAEFFDRQAEIIERKANFEVVCGVETGTVLSFRDMTESFETHEIVDAIYATTTNGYFTIDENGRILDCNPALLKMFDVEDKKEIMRDFMRFSPPFQPDGRISAEGYKAGIAEVMEKGVISFEWMHVDSRNNPVPCEISMTRVHFNQVPVILSGCHDLRDQYKAREAIVQQREQLRHILSSSPITVAVSVDLEVREINDNGTRMLGLRPGDSIAGIYVDAVDREKALGRVASGDAVDNMPMRMKSLDGRLYDTLVSYRPFVYEGQKAVLTWVVDVSGLSRGEAPAAR